MRCFPVSLGLCKIRDHSAFSLPWRGRGWTLLKEVQNMSQSTPLREFVRYSALSSCGMIAVSCYILADTFFVAQGLGTAGLAALNLAIPIYNFIHGTGLMLGMGGATKYSIHQSRGDPGGASRMFTGMLLLSVLFSIPFLLLGLFCSHGITVLLGADQAVFEMTRTYLQVLLLFAPATLVNDVLLCFVRNDGDPRLSMLATAAGSLANIVLDYIFIFPMGMGIFGAVLATGMSPVLGILILLPHCIRKKGDLRLVPGPTASALSLGLPSLLAQLSSAVVMIAFNSIILGLEGNTGVAAYGVIANISLVVTAVYTGISQGIQPLVSTAHGQDRPGLIRQYLRYALITLLVLSAALYLLLFLFAGPVALIFNSEGDPRLQQIAEEGLRLYFTGALFAGFNIILSMYFTSVERALPAHITSLLRGFLLILPMAFLLAACWGMTGVWLAFPLTEAVTAALGAGFYALYARRGRARS